MLSNFTLISAVLDAVCRLSSLYDVPVMNCDLKFIAEGCTKIKPCDNVNGIHGLKQN
jgi:hypothetical protein